MGESFNFQIDRENLADSVDSPSQPNYSIDRSRFKNREELRKALDEQSKDRKRTPINFESNNFDGLSFSLAFTASVIKSEKLKWLPPGIHHDQKCVIVSPGPSVTRFDVIEKIRRLAKNGAVVFGIKEGLKLLVERKIQPRYAVQIDAGHNQIKKTPIVKGVTYCLATTVHPVVFLHLLDGGCPLYVFNSAADAKNAVENEHQLYTRHFRKLGWDGWGAIGGYDVTSRAVAVAIRMGFSKIWVAGADYGFRPGSSYYAKGCTEKAGNSKIEVTDNGYIDGPKRPWITRPDLLGSAVHMGRLCKLGKIHILGDSMAKSLSTHDEEFWKRVAGPNKVIIPERGY